MNNILTYNDKSVTMKRNNRLYRYVKYLIILETSQATTMLGLFALIINFTSCGKSKSLTANLLVKNSFRMWASQ